MGKPEFDLSNVPADQIPALLRQLQSAMAGNESRARTIADAAEAFDQVLVPPHYRPKSVSTARNALRHIVNLLGDVPLDELGPSHARKLLAELEDRPSQANTCIRWLSRLHSWSAEEGLCQTRHGIFRKVRKYREEPRTLDLSIEQARNLYRALIVLPERGLTSIAHSDCLRLVALEGMRRTEATHLEWSEVSFHKELIDLPPSRNKIGRRKLIPLSGEALTMLQRRHEHRIPGNPWVFPGRDPARPVYDLRVPLHKACELAGIEPMCLHQLRHAFATMATSVGRTLEQIAPALGHTATTMTERYSHPGLREARDTVDAVSAALLGEGGGQ